jgi:hypothetical protein
MGTPDPSWTDIVGTAIAAATLFVIASAAIIAWRQLREARRLRRERNRPFVVVDFEREKATRGIKLKVTNIGTSMARNIRIDFTPPLKSSTSPPVPFSELKMFREGIPTLPPGKVIETLFDVSVLRWPRREELPDVYEARVTYTDDTGKRPFNDSMTLDLGVYWNLTWVDRKDMHDLVKRLEEIRDTMKKMVTSGGGLLVMTTEDVKKRNEELMEMFRQQNPESGVQG